MTQESGCSEKAKDNGATFQYGNATLKLDGSQWGDWRIEKNRVFVRIKTKNATIVLDDEFQNRRMGDGQSDVKYTSVLNAHVKHHSVQVYGDNTVICISDLSKLNMPGACGTIIDIFGTKALIQFERKPDSEAYVQKVVVESVSRLNGMRVR
jgi:hypothetical protein